MSSAAPVLGIRHAMPQARGGQRQKAETPDICAQQRRARVRPNRGNAGRAGNKGNAVNPADSISAHCRTGNKDKAGNPGDSSSGRLLGSLEEQLRDIGNVSSDRMLRVKKIQHLHFASVDVLQGYCQAFGQVSHVLVAPSNVMSACGTYVRRLRPASLAVVVMSDADSVQAILMRGQEHTIAGKVVSFEKFEHDSADAASDDHVTAGLSMTVMNSCASRYGAGSVGGCNTDDYVISGDFEYWATDDELL